MSSKVWYISPNLYSIAARKFDPKLLVIPLFTLPAWECFATWVTAAVDRPDESKPDEASHENSIPAYIYN